MPAKLHLPALEKGCLFRGSLRFVPLTQICGSTAAVDGYFCLLAGHGSSLVPHIDAIDNMSVTLDRYRARISTHGKILEVFNVLVGAVLIVYDDPTQFYRRV